MSHKLQNRYIGQLNNKHEYSTVSKETQLNCIRVLTKYELNLLERQTMTVWTIRNGRTRQANCNGDKKIV